MRLLSLATLSLALALSAPMSHADEIADTIASASAAYEAGDVAKALADLSYAQSKLL